MSRSGDECVVALTDQWCVVCALRALCVAGLCGALACRARMAQSARAEGNSRSRWAAGALTHCTTWLQKTLCINKKKP
mgnify:CR=1 FL=1